MLGVGWTEMLVIGVVALIVIGPKDLPMLMQRLGKVVGTVRRMGSEFQREINKTTGLDQVRDLRKSITEPLRQTTAEIAREFNAMGKDGSVQPTGALKPTDPAVESVYDTIAKQAGIETKSPAASAAIAAAVTSSVESTKAAEQVKAAAAEKPAAKPKRVAKATPAPTTPVTATDLPPVPAKPARKAAAKESEPSPAPVEAIAPAKKTEPKAPLKPAASPVKRSTPPKPAAKPVAKPAAVTKTPAVDEPVVAPAKPAAKPRAKKS